MICRMSVFALALVSSTALAGGATVTTTDIYDDYCTNTNLPRGNVRTDCIFADFRIHEVLTPSGNRVYTWDGIRTIDTYMNGVLIREGEFFGKIIDIDVDGTPQVDHRETCFWLDAEDMYQQVKLQIVDGHIVIQEVETVETCD